MRRLIVGMTGATGAILGVRLLEALKECDVESHLVISNWARRTIEHETPYTIKQVSALATVYHNATNMAAEISSGSFITDGMVVIPCSMRTLGSIAHGIWRTLLFIAPPMSFSRNGGDWCWSRASRRYPNCISKTC